MRVAILGCGPTGLLAAHACAQNGVEFHIYSKKRKSFLFGSQYLHNPIPGLDVGPGEPVKYVTIGTPDEYRRKTHGKYWDGIVAPEDFQTDHTAWNIRHAYDLLWQRYSRYIMSYEMERVFDTSPFYSTERDLRLDLCDLVISTVPRTIWKVQGEEFVYSEGWAAGDAPEHGMFVPYDCEDNTIICDGTPYRSWNRLSKVFGYTTVEWPNSFEQKPPIENVSKITKPLRYESHGRHNPANAENWLHVGRYGKWQKGVVVTDAYDEVDNRLKEMTK